jgi:hypothetical protein
VEPTSGQLLARARLAGDEDGKALGEGRHALEVREDLAHHRAVPVELAEVVPVRQRHADRRGADDLDARAADAEHRLHVQQGLPHPRLVDVYAVLAVEVAQPDPLLLDRQLEVSAADRVVPDHQLVGDVAPGLDDAPEVDLDVMLLALVGALDDDEHQPTKPAVARPLLDRGRFLRLRTRHIKFVAHFASSRTSPRSWSSPGVRL